MKWNDILAFYICNKSFSFASFSRCRLCDKNDHEWNSRTRKEKKIIFLLSCFTVQEIVFGHPWDVVNWIIYVNLYTSMFVYQKKEAMEMQPNEEKTSQQRQQQQINNNTDATAVTFILFY